MTWDDPSQTLSRLNKATAELDPPLAILDVRAFESNRRDLARRAGGTPIRVASKSLRCRWVLGEVLKHPGFHGVLGFSVHEAIWLATPTEGWDGIDDIVLGYPNVDRAALRQLIADAAMTRKVTLMIDDLAHVKLLEGLAAGTGNQFQVCIDVDASWRPKPPGLKNPIHVGVRRSPLHDADAAVKLAQAVTNSPATSLRGLMFYEAQIAGMGDRPAGNPVKGRLIHAMHLGSGKDLMHRRPEIVAAVEAELSRLGAPALEFVNAGGTGSLELSSSDPSVTEVTAGSGFYAPTLFDTYSHFHPTPATAFAVSVVRRPGPGIVTVLGGGYVASGPADPSRLPTPWLPEGLKLDPDEGAGEVQTPLKGAAADKLAIGDKVWFRHAKAGELSERFSALQLIRDDEVVNQVPTYRGEGKTYL